MPEKCKTCKHHSDLFAANDFEKTHCTQPRILAAMGRLNVVPITAARDICDKEADGYFVYFEPKTPAAGAAADAPIQRPLRRAAGGVI